MIEGGRGENAALLEQRFDYIFFTGSPAVGRAVMAAAAEHLTPVTLELGGKSPVIVAADADVELAAARIVWGKCVNAGQTCVAPDHVWVPEGMREKLVEAMGRQIRRFYGPDPLAGEDLPRIVNRKHFDRLCRLLESGRTAHGGQTDRERLRIAPTVLVDVTEEDAVMGEEIFGPILPGADLFRPGCAGRPSPGQAPAPGPVPVHPQPGRGAAGAGAAVLRRRVRQRHGGPPGHAPDAFRRGGQFRHGPVPRQGGIRHLYP